MWHLDSATSGRVQAVPMRAVTRAAPIALAALGLLAGCNGSDGTGPSQPVVISMTSPTLMTRVQRF